jgi:hypothetical protein
VAAEGHGHKHSASKQMEMLDNVDTSQLQSLGMLQFETIGIEELPAIQVGLATIPL